MAGQSKGNEGAAANSGERLLFVSAGLSSRGGGVAAAGRLLLAATRDLVARRGVVLRVLTLGDEIPAGFEGQAFAGNRAALAQAVWRSQLFEGYEHHLYDFLGVARIQGVLPRRLRARYLLYLYGIECWRPLRGSRLKALTGAAVRLACSLYTVERLRHHNPRAPAVTPLHLALDDDRSDPGDADQRMLDELGRAFVLVVGRMAPGERYKGHDELLTALTVLAPAQPELRLVIVGEGDDRRRLEAKARELGVVGRVSFAGFVNDATLSALYRNCALFAMPSIGEGFGFVYLEAMRAGRPCIARADSAAAEIVVGGETGRLVAAGVEPLAAAIDGLIADPARAAALGAAGRERWERDFRPQVFTDRFSRHLDALLERTPVHGSAAGADAISPSAPSSTARSGLLPPLPAPTEP